MAVYIILTVVFLAFSIIFAFNKGDFLIAGLNNSESNRNDCDTKKINRMTKIIIFVDIFIADSLNVYNDWMDFNQTIINKLLYTN